MKKSKVTKAEVSNNTSNQEICSVETGKTHDSIIENNWVSKIDTLIEQSLQMNDATILPEAGSFSRQNNAVKLSHGELLNLSIHPYLEMYPKATDEEFEALTIDILQHGIIKPIILNKNNQIVSGRARYTIYKNNPEKVNPNFVYLDSEINDEDFIISDTIYVKSLNKGQLAIIAVKTYNYIIDMRSKNKDFKIKGYDFSDFENSRELIAKMFSVSTGYLANAQTLFKNDTSLCEAVMNKTYSINEAYNLHKYGDIKPNKSEKEAIDSDDEFEETSYEEQDSSIEQSNISIIENEDKKQSTKTTNTNKNNVNKISTKEEFEIEYRPLKKIENAFFDFIHETNLSKNIDEKFFKALINEIELIKSTSKLSVDEQYTELASTFLVKIGGLKFDENSYHLKAQTQNTK